MMTRLGIREVAAMASAANLRGTVNAADSWLADGLAALVS